MEKLIEEIMRITISVPERIYGNMDKWTTIVTWESIESELKNMSQKRHFEFISSLFVMTVFHQAVYQYFNGEYAKYRNHYHFPEFGWCGMAGTHHEEPWDLFTYALKDNIISLEELDSRSGEIAELFKSWAEFMIDNCNLGFTYENLIEKLRTDYTLAVRQKVRNQHREGFSEKYVSAIEEVIRQMLGCSEEERQEDLTTIERKRQMKRLREKHHVGMKYLEDK